MSENSQDYAQKPQLNHTFINFASGQAKIFHRTGLNTFSHQLATVCTPLVTFFRSWRKSYQCIALRLKSSWYHRTKAGRGGGEGEGLVHGLNNLYIDTKAKCHHLKILSCKGTLRQVFICLRPPPHLWPHTPTLYTLYTCILVYLFTQGRRGGRGS
jgi:hypothetical protein